MKHNFSDIEIAYEFVSARPPLINTAILCRETGRIYFLSEMGDSDEDAPDNIFENDTYIEIPHKNDLDLGTLLVQQFIQDYAPDLSDDIASIFSRKGAYSRFKGLLNTKGLLNSWHEYEDRQTKIALKEWCKENDIELVQPS